ncbi:hypothetical protein M885DRAFT_583371 [Pelagophyceae sp. CCMP2097]|nr:hypothetical protein M885DRAFT_583371 [Pelagophyceae sp. CCMP2097]
MARPGVGAAWRALSTRPRPLLPQDGPSFGDFLQAGRPAAAAVPPRRLRPDFADSSLALEPASARRRFLTDKFGRFHDYLRISLTEKCNLRCQYCMPAEGVPALTPKAELLDAGEIARVVGVFAGCGGARKVRFTGGEPTIRRDLVEICESMTATKLGGAVEGIGLTTNGVTLLGKRPDGRTLLEALVAARVDSLNISLDSLDAEKFARISRRPPATHGRVLAAVEAAAALSRRPGVRLHVKVNCVVMRGSNDVEAAAFAKYFVARGVDVRFIEWMPFASNDWDASVLVPQAELLASINKDLPDMRPLAAEANSTTQWYGGDNWVGPDGAKPGRVGFISSMTEHFCGTCNRVRVTADGQLKTCLFGRDSLSLRDLVRDEGKSDADIAGAIEAALRGKHFKHGGHGGDLSDLAADAQFNRPMVHIGG